MIDDIDDVVTMIYSNIFWCPNILLFYVYLERYIYLLEKFLSTHLRGIYQLYVLRFRILRWKNVSMRLLAATNKLT